MTIAAYKDGVLASDTMVSDGISMTANIHKIAKHRKGHLAAFAGEVAAGMLFLRMFKAAANPLKVVYPDTEGLVGIIITTPDRQIYCLELGVVYPILDEHIAIGSGATFATPLLDAGLSAVEAVAGAIKRDLYSGGEIVRACLTPSTKR